MEPAACRIDAPPVLVVDDDPVHRRITAARLSRNGQRVLDAGSGPEALELARTGGPPAVVLCDWEMEGMDGLQVCSAFKADPALSGCHFILLTARSGEPDRIRGLDCGADDFLSKPISQEELMARVRCGLRLHDAAERLRLLSADLQAQHSLMETEIQAAARYVQQLLPVRLEGDVQVVGRFQPCFHLGGDAYDSFWVDRHHLVLYILDVSGHGLAAALPSVSVVNLLRSGSLRVPLTRPAAVLCELNRRFEMEEQGGRYFTIWYGVFDRRSRLLRYSSAGHPPGLLLRGAPHVQPLSTRNLPVGLLENAEYDEGRCRIERDSRLLLYSDGLYECDAEDRTPLGLIGLEDLAARLPETDPGLALDHLFAEVSRRLGAAPFSDDASALLARFAG
ncbi:response regulator [Synechococcus sp. RSCCF101]|uniref:PP2C family protein-serine/threonine phosphatase n=1 Tax=Synechococcus sp. RSCCF101 TaxID=2511069 RepID=UPI0012485B92|nr:SpoIIE family protein phosphatase [Synechococcus sp. RSCCF101]QEY31057.1 response regulator [Synechococcus sp. RSCCF101]